ncbi:MULTISPECIES: PAS domain S-box protein [unclassified Archaeoglobus]|jgi:PAS domain S-box-containing protein|uniref:PAS domain S-box protein n=1 Tax=unclassified Archaeoglobus TaxID=2643606 RepID=UPI0025BA37D0|nr:MULTISPECIES: PAS domain S-box protein [unclassified Archaeoglobus]
MRSIFVKIVISSLIISTISAVLYTILQFLPEYFAIAYDFYVLIIILGISMFLAGSITEPLERLRNGFEYLLNGKYIQVEIDTRDEFEDMGRFFNKVAKELIEREKILRETEKKYRNLVENLNDWIFETDNDLNIIFSNIKGYELFREKKIIGRNLRDFLLDVPEIGHDSCSFETHTISGRIFEFSLNPLYEEGKVVGFIGIGRDITDRKRAEERLAHLAAITEHTIDAVVSLDIDGNIVSWNKGAEAMFGYKAEEMIGKKFTILMADGMSEQCRENFRKAILEGYAKDIETVRLTKDGRKIIVDQTLTSIHNSKGEVTGFVVIMRDITEKKKSEEKLKKAYEELEKRTAELKYLANIIGNSNEAIYSFDMEGKITSWNKGAENLFGWQKSEALGMHVKELLPEDFEKETEYIIQKIKNGIQNLSFEGKRKRKDGSIVDVEITASPILENDEISGISMIVRDMSYRVKSEQELLRRILKYKVDIGKVYLTDNFELALDVLSDMAKASFVGTVITRRLPEEVNVDCKVLWLSEKEGKDTIHPDATTIEKTILNFPAKNNVVVLELDYLVTKIDFESLLSMIQRIREDFYILKRGVVILVATPGILDATQLSLLKMECNQLEKKKIKLSPELYEMLRFVYMKNKTGEKPSIKEAMDELGLARNTVKKRIKQLRSRGLINIVKYGRTKILEVTEEGRLIFD